MEHGDEEVFTGCELINCACVCCREWARIKCTIVARMPGDVYDTNSSNMPRELLCPTTGTGSAERVTQLERLLTAIVKGVWYRPRETTYNQLLNTTLGEGFCGYTFETAH